MCNELQKKLLTSKYSCTEMDSSSQSLLMLQIWPQFYFLMLALRGGKTETDCLQAICVIFKGFTVKFAETSASENV